MSSHSEQSAQTGAASTITAKNLTLMAVSSPALPGDFKPTAGRDVTIRGSQIKASGSAEVVAEGKIDLLASQDQASMSSSNQSESSGVGLGASLGPKGPVAGVKVEGSQGHSQAQGQSLTNRNTTIEAGEVASFKSGGDMSVKGAVVSAKQIVADVGGRLEVESLQDKRSYQSEQSSVSGSVTVGKGASVTASVSDSELRQEFASVGEQSGLRAGDGGFQITAASGIQLVGAQITSTQAAVDQHLNVVNAPSIEYADVQNKLETKGQAYSVSVTLGTTGPGFSGGVGRINDHATSVSHAGISGFGTYSRGRHAIPTTVDGMV
jgi:filamentous hemagglutinin